MLVVVLGVGFVTGGETRGAVCNNTWLAVFVVNVSDRGIIEDLGLGGIPCRASKVVLKVVVPWEGLQEETPKGSGPGY